MIIKGAKRKVAAPKKVEKPAAAPKKERKAHKVVASVAEPIVETPVVEEAIEVANEE